MGKYFGESPRKKLSYKLIDVGGWIALAVFAIVLVAAFIKTQDLILLFLGMFVVAAGTDLKFANNQFGHAIDAYREAGENVMSAFDSAIEEEEKKEKKRGKKPRTNSR